MVHSLAGELMGGRCASERPFRAPHHSASMAALVGGGSRPEAGRGVAGASGRAVSRRVAGILATGARQAAPAAGDRRDRDRARQSSDRLSVADPAGGGDESVPLRRRARAELASAGLGARPTISRGFPGRCSIGSICRSRCRRFRRRISSCRRRQKAARRLQRAWLAARGLQKAALCSILAQVHRGPMPMPRRPDTRGDCRCRMRPDCI